MNSRQERILTTHTGSLPRPAVLAETARADSLKRAVAENVRLQLDAGIDIISDGEAGKPSYVGYVKQRLSGLTGQPAEFRMRGLDAFPEFAQRLFSDPDSASVFVNPTCDGPVKYLDTAMAKTDIVNLLDAVPDASAEMFMTAASPGVIQMFMPNRYYASDEEYLYALAEALKTEYDAIYHAGLVLQLDCPDLASGWALGPELSYGEFRKKVAQRVEVINYATRDIPPGGLRMHICWGNYEGPHNLDIPLAEIIGEVLRARPAALSVEGANPRHEHEWQVFEDLSLPEGKVIIPGVIDTTTNYIEHPQLVAQRLARYAGVVGRERVIAGTDCGFATFAPVLLVDPRIVYAKLAAMVEGASMASRELWR